MPVITRRGGAALGAALVACGAPAVAVSARPGPGAAPDIGPGLIGSPAHLGDPHNAVIAVHTRSRLVAVTFDDGPSRRFTPAVLTALRRSHARATFFVIGDEASRAPQLVRDELAAGHELGDHTWSHLRLVALSDAALHGEIARGAAAVTAITRIAPRLFRPPHGDFDDRVSSAVAQAGLRMIGWDLAVERELRGRSPAAATRALLARVRPGSIVLAHDGGGDRARTVEVLGLLLPALRRRGFRVVTVSALLRAARAQPIARTSPLSLPTSSVPSPASAG